MKRHDRSSNCAVARKLRAAFSLVELLVVILVVTVVASVIVLHSNGTNQHRLSRAAEIIAADLENARDLAISNSSNYRVTFDLTQNRYTLQHTGTNSALDTLPTTIYANTLGSATQRVRAIGDLPGIATALQVDVLHSVAYEFGGEADTTTLTSNAIEFNSLGATTETSNTRVWLKHGPATDRHYLAITVSATTGAVSVGNLQTSRDQSEDEGMDYGGDYGGDLGGDYGGDGGGDGMDYGADYGGP